MPHTSCYMVQSLDTVAPSFSCSSCRNCCVFSFLSAMLRPWKSRASSANWSNWRWFLTWENLWSPRGLESYLPKNPLCEDVMSTEITKYEDLRNQHGGLTNTFSKPKMGVMVHRNEAKKQTWTMTNARWITSSLIMIPQMMGIGKLTGLKYRPGPIRPPTPEVKGTSLRPPIRPRCATSPGFQVQGLGGPKAVSWVGPLPSNNCKWSFKSESGNLKNATKCWWIFGRMLTQAVRPATFSPLSYTTESWKVDL